MHLGFLGRQRLHGHADLTADRVGDQPEWHALGDGMECLVPGVPFQCQAEDAGGIQPMHGWPEVLSVTDIGGNTLLAGYGGKHGNEAMAFADTMAAFVHATVSWLDDPGQDIGERLDLVYRELNELLAERDH